MYISFHIYLIAWKRNSDRERLSCLMIVAIRRHETYGYRQVSMLLDTYKN